MLFGRRVVNDTVLRAQDQTTSEQSTKTLSKAIGNENLEDFKQALAKGEDINAFDEEGTTPLMSIASIYITSNNQPALKEMAKLLIQKRSININVQSKQFISVEQWRFDSITRDMVAELRTTFNTRKDTALHTSCQVGARDIVKILLTHPDVRTDVINCENKGPKDCIARGFENIVRLEFEKAQKGKELLNALSGRNIDRAKRLLNQELNPNCWRRASNGEIETPLSLIIKSCLQRITQDNEEVLTKLLKHKELDFSQTKPIPAIEQNSRLKQIIERAMKERLTDAINRKDLDDVKELVEDNCFINRAIVTAALRNVNNPIESIKNYLNEKFPASMEQLSANAHNVAPAINDEFIAQELQRLENLEGELERTNAQLTEKEQELNRAVSERTRDTNKILQLERELRQVRQDNQERIRTFTDQVTQLENLRDELERTNAQLTEKEQELNRAVSERTRDTNKILQLERDFGQERLELQAQNQDLKNKNKKLSEANIYNRRQSNYASSFVLSGVFAVGACLTISNLEICISLAVAAFVFLTIGCYCSYKASTVLSDVTSTEFGNVIDLG